MLKFRLEARPCLKTFNTLTDAEGNRSHVITPVEQYEGNDCNAYYSRR